MKNIAKLCLAVLPWLLFLFTLKGICGQSVQCQWGPYGDWSECDGCTKLQTRSRAMAVYAQYGGNPCGGMRMESRSCETTKGCPLEDGCGDRFRCRSGKCVSQSLVCNGDQDCEEDGDDETSVCDPTRQSITCEADLPPPNIEHLGLGYDMVTGQRRGSVINTKSFGGQCRTVLSGTNNAVHRMPLSITQYSFMVKAQNDFSDEMFTSTWHYAKDIVNRKKVSGTTEGYHNYDFHETHDTTKKHKILILKNNIEVAQFQSNSPQYLPISEELWKALAKLPSVYDYAAYRTVLEKFGTHYLSEGSLGGSLNIVSMIDEETEKKLVTESMQYRECVRTKRWFLFFPIIRESCSGDSSHHTSTGGKPTTTDIVFKVDVVGGGVQHIAAVKTMKPSNPDNNWEIYSNWADSIRLAPQVIKQKLRPLSELVKEVQCAGVKKLYLRRAIEQYLTESDPCHCQPCSNNGMAVMGGDVCKCICKPGTSGLACEQGTEVEGQQGVIHGGWSCWSTWSTCSGNQRSRSRSCSNPASQNGGQHCIGEPTETSPCEDQDIQYLKTMEPQCFDQTLPASQKCGTPPDLINGYILDPKDIYLVGSRVQYTCTVGFYLIGQSTLECTADRTWSASTGLCTVSKCKSLTLADGVIASPLKDFYDIGDIVTLSCPSDRQLLGEATIICDPSLRFSPDPADIKCSPVSLALQIAPSAQCEPWQKSAKGKCVCRMPFECGSSLELCTTKPASGKSVLLNVCKLHALQCMKKDHVIAEDSTCQWPLRSTTSGCTNCPMWETCDAQTSECRCKDSADCLIPGLNVCVRVGEDATAATQTMSECEAGLQRCKGAKVSVVSILPCTP